MLYSFLSSQHTLKDLAFPLPRQMASRPENEGSIKHAGPNLFSLAKEKKKVRGKKVAINNKGGISRSTTV